MHTCTQTNIHKLIHFIKSSNFDCNIIGKNQFKRNLFFLSFMCAPPVIRCHDLYHSDGSPVNAYVKVSDEMLFNDFHF